VALGITAKGPLLTAPSAPSNGYCPRVDYLEDLLKKDYLEEKMGAFYLYVIMKVLCDLCVVKKFGCTCC
jgi:hypothetical protein